MDNKENNGKKGGDKAFGLPDGYFQRSAGSILNRIEWEEEHKDLPILLDLKKAETLNQGGFTLPENYFVKKEVRLELVDHQKLLERQGKNPFITPPDYFQTARQITLSTLMTEEVDELHGTPVLAALKRSNPFVIPHSYHEESKSRLTETLRNPKNKVIHLFSKKFSYAVAAMLVVALGVWIYSAWLAPDPTADCGTIACIDKIDLVKTKNLENLENEELYELVNPAELEKELEKKSGKKNEKDSVMDDIRADELLDEI